MEKSNHKTGTIAIFATALGLLVAALSMSSLLQPAVAQDVSHGDVVSGAAKIVGPDISTTAQIQKDPGTVSDPAKIVGPDISEIAQLKD